MKLKPALFLSAFSLFLFSCKQENGKEVSSIQSVLGITKDDVPKELMPSDYVQWVQDINHGLKKEKKIEDITFLIQYKPLDYIICEEEKSDSIESKLRNKKIAELEDMEYYDLKIMLTNGEGELLKYNVSSPQEYNERVKYFAFEMQKDISLVRNGDSIPCSLYHFERAYDVAPFSTILLGFKREKSKNTEGESTIVFHDKIFEKGIIKFTFNYQEQNNLPKLRTI